MPETDKHSGISHEAQPGCASSIRHAVEAAAALDRSGWPGAARAAELVELLAAQERLAALIVRVAGAWDRDQTWTLDGASSPVAWLAHRAPLTRQAASVLVRTARHVAAHDQTAKALDAGDVSTAHVELAARAAQHRERSYAEHEDVILEAARQLRPSEFRLAMAHWRACADAVADHREALDHVEGNFLAIATTFDGVGHLEGRLDPASTATLVAVLDTLEPPDSTGGARPPRTLAQRRAAALMRLVRGDTPPPVGIDVLVDVDTLAGRPSPDLTTGCCQIRGVGPVSPALVRTLACDAAIGRVLRRGASEILDLGRRARLVTPALRRAVELRDRGCVEHGCDAPPEWCDAHHIVPWWAHGDTALDNLELRCRPHHVRTHLHDLLDRLRRHQE